jgi:hypothetical protein
MFGPLVESSVTPSVQTMFPLQSEPELVLAVLVDVVFRAVVLDANVLSPRPLVVVVDLTVVVVVESRLVGDVSAKAACSGISAISAGIPRQAAAAKSRREPAGSLRMATSLFFAR